MKKLFFVLCVSILMWNCGPKAPKEVKPLVATVDVLYATQDSTYLGKEVTLTGSCIGVCPHSGKKLFLVGTDENKVVVVFAGEDQTFDNDLEGKTLSVKGVISQFDKEACCKGKEAAEVAETEPATETAETEAEEGHECATATKEIAFKLDCVSLEVAPAAN